MKKLLNFIAKTSSGMALGLFSTLIIGTIIKQISVLCNNFQLGVDVGNALISLMGIGIALGVSLSIKKDLPPLHLISSLLVGFLASKINLISASDPTPVFLLNGGSNNPLLIYLVTIFAVLLCSKILSKKTPLDILLIPIVYVIVSLVFSFILIYPCYYLIYGIQRVIEISMPIMPVFMSMIISLIVGMVLTLPISSVAVCIAIDIGLTPLAAGAAVIGCTVQMIGFAVQSIKAKNGIAKSISVGIGTSMLYWPNIIKKPAIWLPTMCTSIILGPIGVCLLGVTSTSAGAGMGSCGLVGQLSMLETMGYDNPNTYIAIFGVQLVLTIVLVLLFDYLFNNKLKLYSNEDLKLN